MMRLFKKKNIRKPIHWADVTIAQHKKIMEVFDREEDDFLILYGLTSIFYGDIDNMKISEANALANTLAFVREKPKPSRAKAHYVLNGHKYNTTLNMQELNTSQYIDFQNLADKSGEMPAEFLSILLIPEGHKYNEGYRIEDVASDIENYMSVEDAFGLSAFFFNLLQISMKRSIRKLKKLTKAATKEGMMTNEQLEALKAVSEKLESASGLRQWMP